MHALWLFELPSIYAETLALVRRASQAINPPSPDALLQSPPLGMRCFGAITSRPMASRARDIRPPVLGHRLIMGAAPTRLAGVDRGAKAACPPQV